MQGRDDGGWGGGGRRWRGAEIKWIQLANGCEERGDAEHSGRICLERRGGSRVRFWTSYIYLGDIHMEMSYQWSDMSMEVRRERS